MSGGPEANWPSGCVGMPAHFPDTATVCKGLGSEEPRTGGGPVGGHVPDSEPHF